MSGGVGGNTMPESTEETPEQKHSRCEKEHERRLKLTGGYAGFVAALFITTLAVSGTYAHAWIVGSLLVVSLPSLIAFIVLDFTIRVRQKRKKSAALGLAFVLGFLPSFCGIVMVIGHLSIVAAVLFVLVTVYWVLRHDRIVYLNPGEQSDM